MVLVRAAPLALLLLLAASVAGLIHNDAKLKQSTSLAGALQQNVYRRQSRRATAVVYASTARTATGCEGARSYAGWQVVGALMCGLAGRSP